MVSECGPCRSYLGLSLRGPNHRHVVDLSDQGWSDVEETVEGVAWKAFPVEMLVKERWKESERKR